MNVRVQFYAQLRDLAGRSEWNVEVSENATVTELLEHIYDQTPQLRSHDRVILVGAGVEFVDRAYVLKPEETIAIMPPVQGG
jgi:molybdopterin converting factor small subunit